MKRALFLFFPFFLLSIMTHYCYSEIKKIKSVDTISIPFNDYACGNNCPEIKSNRYYRSELESFFEKLDKNIPKDQLFKLLEKGIVEDIRNIGIKINKYLNYLKEDNNSLDDYQNKMPLSIEVELSPELFNELVAKIEGLRLLTDFTKKYLGTEMSEFILQLIKKNKLYILWEKNKSLCAWSTKIPKVDCPISVNLSLIELIDKLPNGKLKDELIDKVNQFESLIIEIDDDKVCPSPESVTNAANKTTENPIQSQSLSHHHSKNEFCGITQSMVIKKGLLSRPEIRNYIGGRNSSHNCSMVVLYTVKNKVTHQLQRDPSQLSYLIYLDGTRQELSDTDMDQIIIELKNLTHRPNKEFNL